VHPARKPTWQQATALVSLSTCGAMTGFAFAHGTVGEVTSPTRIPVGLMALKKPVSPAASSQPSRAMAASEKAMRAAVVIRRRRRIFYRRRVGSAIRCQWLASRLGSKPARHHEAPSRW